MILERVGERGVEPGHAAKWCLEPSERALLHGREQLCPEAAGARSLVGDEQAAGLLHGSQHRLDVVGGHAYQVDQLYVVALTLGTHRRVLRYGEHGTVRDERRIDARTHDFRAIQRQRVVLGRHVTATSAVDALGLEEDHGVRTLQRGEQQTLGLSSSGRNHDSQARRMREVRLRALRVVEPPADASAVGGANHDLWRVLPARAIAVLGELVHDLVERRKDEVDELDLHDGPEAR